MKINGKDGSDALQALYRDLLRIVEETEWKLQGSRVRTWPSIKVQAYAAMRDRIEMLRER